MTRDKMSETRKITSRIAKAMKNRTGKKTSSLDRKKDILKSATDVQF